MRLAVGTANFGSRYGVFNTKIKNPRKIFKFLKKNNIDYIDTALNYKNQKTLIKENLNKFKIITKIKLPIKKKKLFIKNLEFQINRELTKLNIESFDYILFHDINDLSDKISKNFVKKVQLLKKHKFTKGIGVSIYNPDDLKLVFNHLTPDLIQVPINIFDTRFLNSRWFKKIKNKSIKIQARSIFLQGALVKDLRSLEKINNKKLFNNVRKFDNWCKINNLSRLEACIYFIKSINNVNIVTLGFENIEQLKKIVNIIKKRKKIKFKNFSIKNLQIIDPRKL